MQELIRMLHEGGYSCVIRNGERLRTCTRRGVADLYDLLEREPELLRGAEVADKVIGKGAAALLILGGVRRLHAEVVSREALALLRDAPVELTCGTCTPCIENRDRTGPCPLESRCAGARTAAECLPLIRDFVRGLARTTGRTACVVGLLLGGVVPGRAANPGRNAAAATHPAAILPASALPAAATLPTASALPAAAALPAASAAFAAPPASSSAADSLPGLSPHPIEGVVVTGARQAVDPRLLPMTVSVVGRRRIDAAERPSLLPTLTEQVPGLFVTGRGVMGYGVSTGAAGGMSVRGIGGSPTTGVLVLIDGQPQYMGLMGHPIADACQSMLAERVEVVRGPASVLYGTNAAGGVVNIVTRRMEREGFALDLHAAGGSYGSFEGAAAARFRRGRLSGVVTASFDRTDGHRPDLGFRQRGGFAKLGCRIGRAWEAAVDLNLTGFDASNPGPVTAPLLDNDARIVRGRGSVTLRNDYGATSGAATLYCNWGLHRIDDGYAPGGEPADYRFRSRDRMEGLSLYQTFSLFRGNRLTAGFDFQRFGGRACNRYIDGRPDKQLADKRMHETAGYIDCRQQLGRRLTLDAGIRFDRHSQAGTEWVPQGGLSLRLFREGWLKATVAKGFRFPTIREMYMFPPQNPDLKAERLVNYELAFSQRFAEGRLACNINLYLIRGDNRIVLLPYEGRSRYANTGRVLNRGFEAEVRWRIGRSVVLSANYSRLRMKYPVVAAPEHKGWFGIDFAGGRWSGTTGLQLVRGLLTQTDPVRREGFVLWNARLTFRCSRRLDLFVRGENLLAQRYEILAGYPMPRLTALGGVNVHFN